VLPDVLVRRCTLTVHGKGGWGWGSDCTPYLAAAIPAIEQALERIIGECELNPDADLVIEEPIRLAWLSDGTLHDQFRHAAVDAIRRQHAETSDAPPLTEAIERPTAVEAPVTSAGTPAEVGSDAAAQSLLDLIAFWSECGRLQAIVAAWPPAVVAQWIDRIQVMSMRADAVQLDTVACAGIAELVLPAESESGLPRRSDQGVLVLIGAFVAAAGHRAIGPATFDQAVRLGGADGGEGRRDALDTATVERVGAGPAGAAGDGDTSMEERSTRPSPRPPRRLTAPGLPFLIMVQLGRIGYLDALVGVAQAVGDVGAAQVWAAGLAGKALPPPDRGWRRRPVEIDAIAVSAALPPGEADGMAHAVQDRLGAMTAPLESALVALYAAGRSAADEITATRTDRGVVCGETAGALPVVWLADDSGFAPILDQLGGPPLTYSGLFAPLAETFGTRLAFPHLDVPQLERHVGAAIGAALGSLGQELWGPDLPNAPMLAIERLADLEVELRLADVLAVAIPRGQRWLDLGRAGLLDRWAIPWAHGGYWELVSW
jgi:hypothetical protein